MSLVNVQQVNKIFGEGESSVQALTDINFSIETGEFVALVGPSGSGKTTLLNMLGGLDKPTSGDVNVCGIDIIELKESKLSEFRLFNIGFVFQSYNLVPVLNAIENVELVMTMQGRNAFERRQKAEDILEKVGLKNQMNRRPSQMSGGQQQRVAVARALATEPELVLADEPTANLDSENASNLLGIMRDLAEQHKTTFIFSTHDVRVMQKARRIITLHDGSIVSDEFQR